MRPGFFLNDFSGFQQRYNQRASADSLAAQRLRENQQVRQQQTVNMAGLQTLLQSLQGQRDAANEANERRYAEMLGMAEQYGASHGQRIDDSAVRAGAAAQSSAIRRGLGNSTIVDSLQRGVERDRLQSRSELEDRQRRMRLDVMAQRQDRGPDASMLQLLMNPGAMQLLGNNKTSGLLANLFKRSG